MSVEALEWARERSKAELQDRLLLWRLAEEAPPDTTDVFTSWRRMAHYCRVSESENERTLRRLQRIGEVVDYLIDRPSDLLAVELPVVMVAFQGPPLAPSSDHIPLGVRAAICERSGGCCEWPGCEAAARPMHHRTPRSVGGEHTVENLAHLCDRHHRFAHSARGFKDATGLGMLRP